MSKYNFRACNPSFFKRGLYSCKEHWSRYQGTCKPNSKTYEKSF